MNKILRIIGNALLIIVIVLLVGYVILRFTNQIEIYKVKTGSMEDDIHVGDYLLVKRQDSYEVGDVVTYKKNDYYITHRIIDKKNGVITTKGDANNMADPAITEDEIVGKLLYKGAILNFVITYKYVFAGVLVGIYLLSYYLDERKKEKADIDLKRLEKEYAAMPELIDVPDKTPREKKKEENKAKKQANKTTKKKTNTTKKTTSNKTTKTNTKKKTTNKKK